ncbi:ABC transporter permease [Virgisporangium ochraceum]|jgi:peptide/nickel transport system permease protein|uniref:Oligopeptide transport system permease protein OppC n=1 Tax=Virgisporangium ochraceum TaxID=65505 RepID=A0A8J4A3T5_9ACTN|nr:ABC transporter permease [Virgisporangium ochraceum]GIJ73718.1 putative peptide transport permease protein [Virgisporangium ochraceum]
MTSPADPTTKVLAEAQVVGAEQLPDETPSVSRGRMIMRRFRRKRLAMIGLVTLVALFLLAFLGPYIAPYDYTSKDFDAFLQPPTGDHWFGTSQTGGDLFAQTLRGMQKSLIIGLLAAVIATGLAALVGATAGYFGGWADRALMWGLDLLLVLPAFLILALISPSLRGKSWIFFVFLLALFQWMITGRIVRGMTLSLKEREYVQAARFMGVGPYKIIFRHILPNMASLLIIDATINVALVIIAEAGLSFFGFGVQPPDISLGTLIAEGSASFLTTYWLFLFPSIMLVAIVLSVNLIGDGLRDALDPHAAK